MESRLTRGGGISFPPLSSAALICGKSVDFGGELVDFGGGFADLGALLLGKMLAARWCILRLTCDGTLWFGPVIYTKQAKQK